MAVGGALRDHAGHGHRTAAWRGGADGGHHGASAEPAALRQRRQHDLVVDGYGILQPRIAANLPSTNRSLYARLHGGEPGIDPYTRAVSDVYQDLFGEGSFIGKGIYDVDAFERALADRLPENRILSHDLLEGCYARSGLLSDVQLYRRRAGDLRRRRGTPLPVDPRRLATGRLAAPPRVGAAVGAAQPVVGALAVEDLRQPAAQPRAGRTRLAAAGGLVAVARARLDDALCRRHRRAAAAGGAFRRMAAPTVAATARRSAGPAGSDRRPASGALGPAGTAHAGLPALRGGLRPGRDRSHLVARAAVEAPAARVAAVGRCPDRHAARDAGRPAAQRARAGDRPGARARLRGRVVDAAPRGAAGRGPHAVAVDVVTAARVVARPAPGAQARRADRGSGRVPAPAGAPDLELLRGARHRHGPPSAARQRAGAPGGTRRPPDVADEHGLRAAGRTGGTRIRPPHREPTAGAAGRHPRDDGAPAPVSRSLLQLVRHDDPRTAAAALCLDGRQREPHRAVDHPALGAAGPEGRAAASGRLAGWRARHLRRAGRVAARRIVTARTRQCGMRSCSSGRPCWRTGIARRSRFATGTPCWMRWKRAPRRSAPRSEPLSRRTTPPLRRPRPSTKRSKPGLRRGHAGYSTSAVRAGANCARWAWTTSWSSEARPACRACAQLAAGGDSLDPAVESTRETARAWLARIETLAARAAATDRSRTWLPVRRLAPPDDHRLQRGRAACRRGLLRPACVRSAPGRVRRDRARAGRAGELVRARSPAHFGGRGAGAPLVERVDVRVPDAHAPDAELRTHPARPDVPRRRTAPDRVRPAAGRPVGHLRVGLQRDRRVIELPVPRVWRAGTRPEARTRR